MCGGQRGAHDRKDGEAIHRHDGVLTLPYNESWWCPHFAWFVEFFQIDRMAMMAMTHLNHGLDAIFVHHVTFRRTPL